MGNPKHIAVIAGLGFFLSFLIGIISGVSFSLLFLRALVTAVLFAVIGFSAEIVIKKILLDKVPDGLPVATAPGSAVDISIEDEDLPEDANAPDFIVSTKLGAVAGGITGDTITQSTESASVSGMQNDSFASGYEKKSVAQQVSQVTADVSDTLQSFSGTSGTRYVAETDDEDLDSLDDLPDIGTLVPDIKKQDTTVIQNSTFALSGTATQHAPDSDNVQDAALMAQAIRTILSKDG